MRHFPVPFTLGLKSLFLFPIVAACENVGFTFNGFQGANLSLGGLSRITPNGLLMMTNLTRLQRGHYFYPYPLHFKNPSDGEAVSFSSTFVFAIIPEPEYPNLSGHGIVFMIAPSRDLPGSLASQYLGLFKVSNNGNPSNHVVAVELDTNQNKEFADINGNHVGIDINSLKSVDSKLASYFTDENGGYKKNLSLISGKTMQLWIEYDAFDTRINVTLAPINVPKPDILLLSFVYNLSPIMKDQMYVGFSSSSGSFFTSHYVLGWSFNMNGAAKELTLSQLPKLPRVGPKQQSKFLTIGLPIVGLVLMSIVISNILFILSRKRKFAEVMEDWETDYGPHRFKFKDLYIATRGFSERSFWAWAVSVVCTEAYYPPLVEIALKRVSHESRQGMREFVAEIVSCGGTWYNSWAIVGVKESFDYMPKWKFRQIPLRPTKDYPQLGSKILMKEDLARPRNYATRGKDNSSAQQCV